MNNINYPNDWEIQPFSDIADFINGAAFKPTDWKTEGLPIIRIQNLNNPEKEFNYFDGKLDERYYVRNGDILLSWSASLGVYRWNRGNAILNQHIFNVKPKGGINEDFLFYISYKAIEDLSRKVHGSTMKHFKKRELDEANVPVPPLVEQRGIVEVLGTVDECIRLTDAVIERAEELKRGLMQQLLTRGIGHTEYKKTPLGNIPKKWDLLSIGDIADVKGGKRLPKGHIFVEGTSKHPYIRVIDMKNGEVESYQLKYLSDETFNIIKRYIINVQDVYISIAGTIGLCGIISKELDGANLTENAAKITNIKKTLPQYLSYYLNSPLGKKQIESLTGQTSQPKLALFRIKKIRVPIPPNKEQEKILQILSNIDKKIETEKSMEKNLISLKKGLMQLLLSGKIRVELKGDGLHRIGDDREANC